MLTFLVSLIVAIVFFSLGHFFGHLFLKGIHNILGRPYMRTIFIGTKDGSMSIDAQFNNLFIYELDRQYSQLPTDMYNPMADDNGKIAVYLYDVISGIADDYLPPERGSMLEDIAADVPGMHLSGGEEVRQVVDLGDVSNKTISNNGVRVDVEQG